MEADLGRFFLSNFQVAPFPDGLSPFSAERSVSPSPWGRAVNLTDVVYTEPAAEQVGGVSEKAIDGDIVSGGVDGEAHASSVDVVCLTLTDGEVPLWVAAWDDLEAVPGDAAECLPGPARIPAPARVPHTTRVSAPRSFQLLPPPPTPARGVVSGAACAVPRITTDVLVIDALTITPRPDALRAMSSRSADDDDDDDDDVGCLLGGRPSELEAARPARRPVDMDDGIDSSSDSEGMSARSERGVSARSARSGGYVSAGDGSGPPPLPRPEVPSPLPDSSPVSLLAARLGDSSLESSPSSKAASPSSNISPERHRLIAYVVEVPAPYPGLQYRQSKDLDDRLQRYARDQATIHGIVEDAGKWLRLSDGSYLPIEVGGKHVLRLAAGEEEPGSGGAGFADLADIAVAKPTAFRTRWDRECDASGEESIPDECPISIPRASFHRILQPASPADCQDSPECRHLQSEGMAWNRFGPRVQAKKMPLSPVSSVDSPPCYPMDSRTGGLNLHEDRSGRRAASFLEGGGHVLLPELEKSADKHTDAAEFLLSRKVDPFGDPDDGRAFQWPDSRDACQQRVHGMR